jgi:plasmid stabilization system protein ParE
MRRQVRLLIAAEIDLARLVEFLAGKSPRAAVRAAATLSKAIRSLDRFEKIDDPLPVSPLSRGPGSIAVRLR